MNTMSITFDPPVMTMEDLEQRLPLEGFRYLIQTGASSAKDESGNLLIAKAEVRWLSHWPDWQVRKFIQAFTNEFPAQITIAHRAEREGFWAVKDTTGQPGVFGDVTPRIPAVRWEVYRDGKGESEGQIEETWICNDDFVRVEVLKSLAERFILLEALVLAADDDQLLFAAQELRAQLVKNLGESPRV